MNKVELKKDIKEFCENYKPKNIKIMYWLDLDTDNNEEITLEIQIDVTNYYGDEKTYVLELLEKGSHAEEFYTIKDLNKKHVTAYQKWLNWLTNTYYCKIEEEKEVIHI